MLDRWTLLACAALALMTCSTLTLFGMLRQLRRLADALSKVPRQASSARPAQGTDQGARALLREDPAGSRLLGRLARFQSERFAPPMREQK